MDNQINNTPKISQVNNSNIPKRNRLEQARKLWYKFSLSKLSVVGLTIILLVVFCAIFAPFIAPYPEDAGAVVNYRKLVRLRALSISLEPTHQEEIFFPEYCFPLEAH